MSSTEPPAAVAAPAPAPATAPAAAVAAANKPKNNTASASAVVNASAVAAAAAAAATAAITGEGEPTKTSTLFIVLAGLVAIIGAVIYLVKSQTVTNALKAPAIVPTESNNAQIAQQQINALAAESDRLAAQRATEGFRSSAALSNRGQQPLEGFQAQAQAQVIPAGKRPQPADKALVNYAVLGCRVAGYLGPKMNGVFKEEDAVRQALARGCRLFIFDIDYLERSPSAPVLVCRDTTGNLLSNNVGSIAKVAAAIAALTRRQRTAGTDPIIILLNVRRLPGKTALARESIQFMSEIAGQLTPIQPYLARSVPQGDVQQQRLEEVLFKLPIDVFENQVLLLTNLDTRGFRQLDIAISPARNLDILVHARIYTSENSALYYYQLPSANTTTPALMQTYEYYGTIPPNRVQAEADRTRNTWCVAMTPELDVPPTAAVLTKLVDQLGVQGIVIDPFAPAGLDAVFSADWFGKKSYISKPAELQYKEAAPITISPADKRLDANGGLLVTPSVA